MKASFEEATVSELEIADNIIDFQEKHNGFFYILKPVMTTRTDHLI